MARTPIKFHTAYCEGRIGPDGYWKADGRDEAREPELLKRLGLVRIKRARDVIWKVTPPKTRYPLVLDDDAEDDADEQP